MADLATAWVATQLVPGDPDDVERLAQRLGSYATGAGDAAAQLRRIGGQDWRGSAAEAFRHQVGEVPKVLERGVGSFRHAADSLRTHARVLRAAQVSAGLALRRWDEAQALSRAWHREDPATRAPQDPGEAGRRRAQAVLDEAREDLRRSARALAHVLDDARHGAPKKPSLLHRTWSAVSGALVSFGKGAAEATWGLATFAWKLTPTYALLDPKGFVDNLAGLGKGLAYGVQHPLAFGKALLDWETWKTDPARALGHLLPDLLLTLATAGAGGVARGASTAARLERLGALVSKRTLDHTLLPRLDDAEVAARLAAHGLDEATPAGQAAAWQTHPPFGHVDDWLDEAAHEGDLVAFGLPGLSGFGIKIGPGQLLPSSARDLFGQLQVAPRRMTATAPPTLRPGLQVFRLTADDRWATSTARANAQFGPGGHAQVYLPGAEAKVAAARLELVGEHTFDPRTLRGVQEDPRYRAVDPSLPRRPLDVGEQTLRGRVEGAAAGLGLAVGAHTQTRCP